MNFVNLLEILYPVGSLYFSVNSISPAETIGGNWIQIEGKFLLGASEEYSSLSIGGSEMVTLTAEQIASHNHSIGTAAGGVGDGGGAIQRGWSGTTTSKFFATGRTGGSQPHDNMPPYLVVYIWYRVS